MTDNIYLNTTTQEQAELITNEMVITKTKIVKSNLTFVPQSDGVFKLGLNPETTILPQGVVNTIMLHKAPVLAGILNVTYILILAGIILVVVCVFSPRYVQHFVPLCLLLFALMFGIVIADRTNGSRYCLPPIITYINNDDTLLASLLNETLLSNTINDGELVKVYTIDIQDITKAMESVGATKIKQIDIGGVLYDVSNTLLTGANDTINLVAK